MRARWLILGVAALAAVARPALADSSTVAVEDDDTVVLTLTQDTSTPGNSTHHGGPQPAEQPPPPNLRLVTELRVDPATGRTCAFIYDAPGAYDARDEARAIDAIGLYGLCPGSKAVAGTPSAAGAAAQVWRDGVHLDPPTLTIRPGWAVTGKPAFLEIGGDRTLNRPFHVFGYDIAIAAGSTYDVDWGDGTTATGLTTQGGPWPDGPLSHVYERAALHTVTVVQRWTADWSIGPNNRGRIANQLLTRTTLALETRQVQAVRSR
jgi:hypothetical protein